MIHSQDIKNISSDVIKTIDLSEESEVPSDNEVAADPPKNKYNFNTPK